MFDHAHTRQLIHNVRHDATLRQLCGWCPAHQLPHESTFSRALAEFAQSQLSQFAHEALIGDTHQQRLVGHIARDSTPIAAVLTSANVHDSQAANPRCA